MVVTTGLGTMAAHFLPPLLVVWVAIFNGPKLLSVGCVVYADLRASPPLQIASPLTTILFSDLQTGQNLKNPSGYPQTVDGQHREQLRRQQGAASIRRAGGGGEKEDAERLARRRLRQREFRRAAVASGVPSQVFTFFFFSSNIFSNSRHQTPSISGVHQQQPATARRLNDSISMVDNIEGALKNEWNTKDLKILTSQIKDNESLIRLKRRWLMDLPLSVKELKKMEEMLPPNDKVLPESFIREDDVSYEDIRAAIEMGFGAHKCGKERQCAQEDVQVYNPRECLQKICSLLDDMSNKGLCSLIEVLTGGMINFEKTNLSMKRRIKELLPMVAANRNNISKTKLKQISQLLQDPKTFRGGQLVCSTASEAYRAAAIDVLDRLTGFHWRALLAMHRKLDGVKSYVPSLHPPRSGLTRKKLCSTLKNTCKKFLSHLRDVDEPAEELAGALGVAALTLKLMNCPDVWDFRKFSPEIEALQNDIAKAIHLINLTKRVSLTELKKVQVLLDPNLELSDKSLRNAVRSLLTEYLFECSDMDSVPDSLVETVNFINTRSQFPSLKKRRSSKSLLSPQEFMGDVIQKEVEHVLTVSALAKEVVLNIIPEHEFDENFARAYLEDFAGNHVLCISDDERVGVTPGHYELHSSDSYDGKSESIGETMLVKSGSPSSTSKRDDDWSPFCSPDQGLAMSLESMHIPKIDWDETDGSDCSLFRKESKVLDSSHNGVKSEEDTSSYSTNQNCVSSEFLLETDIVSQHSRSCNKYLQVQEACDATSMVAYRFVGRLLDKLANIEGLELCKVDRLYLGGDSSDVDDSEDVLLTSQFSEMWKNAIDS